MINYQILTKKRLYVNPVGEISPTGSRVSKWAAVLSSWLD